MHVRYDKLWSLMKSNKMKKSELASAAQLRLCKVFHCDIGDVMEIIED